MTKRIKRTFEEARDFAGAEWQNMKPESRSYLLRAHGLSQGYTNHRWWELPPTVKRALAESVVERKQVVGI